MEAASALPLASQAAQATLALADLLARTAAVAILLLPLERLRGHGRGCALSPSSTRAPVVEVLVRLVLLVYYECNTSVTTSVRLVHC